MLTSQQTSPTGDPVLTVSQISSLVKETLEELFPTVWVTGEISNFRRPSSGHVYFDLKDETAVLHSVIWRSSVRALRFEPEDGQQVVCQGGIDVYPPHGKYQFIARRMEPVGEGALQLAYRQLHDRLRAEGLFDDIHKQPPPTFPQSIAFVTSPTGAAVRDFLNIAARRWPAARILIIPARVQGDGAAAEIVAGIEQANRLAAPPDVIVVGRGGGSLEDLWCFNEEIVVRSIFASRIPVISAVGHEIDTTLSDLVADVRAPTPSAAAELELPDQNEIRSRLVQQQTRLQSLLTSRAAQARERLHHYANHRVFRRPLDWLRDHAQQLDDLEQRAVTALSHRLQLQRAEVESAAGRLESLSPLAVLRRGYSLTTRQSDQQVIRDADQVAQGEVIVTQLANGQLVSRVE